MKYIIGTLFSLAAIVLMLLIKKVLIPSLPELLVGWISCGVYFIVIDVYGEKK